MNDFKDDHLEDNAADLLQPPPEQLFELLSDRALFGLDDSESERLETLLRENSWVRADCLDETAAELATAFEQAEPMPAEIADRIRSAYDACLQSDEKTADLGGSLGTRAFTEAVVARL